MTKWNTRGYLGCTGRDKGSVISYFLNWTFHFYLGFDKHLI